ncbi:MAG: hypothetical protein WA981_15060 [Glaciecola sp.]
MSAINSIQQSVFTNKQAELGQQKQTETDKPSTKPLPVVIDAEYVNAGNVKSAEQADELFSRANSYASMSESVSLHVQTGLKAYTQHELSSKRDAISELMGVDLYA